MNAEQLVGFLELCGFNRVDGAARVEGDITIIDYPYSIFFMTSNKTVIEYIMNETKNDDVSIQEYRLSIGKAPLSLFNVHFRERIQNASR